MLCDKIKRSEVFTAVDIFAGGGGLTVGLKRSGFEVLCAVELDPYAYATYKVNHPEVITFKQDIRTVEGWTIRKFISNGNIDLLAGCPPCQGFSSLTSKYRRKDTRNELINEMARMVKELKPRVVMMENVPGLAKKGYPLLEKFLKELKVLGYESSWKILQVADYGVPQLRRRLVLLAGLGFRIQLPKPTHSRNGNNNLNRWKSVRKAIQGMTEPVLLSEIKRKGGPQEVGWHVVRSLSDENKKRLQYAKPGKSRTEIPDEYRPKCHKGKNKGFSNVYGRLEWDQPSVTITGGCTTLSMGRFGHPEKDRTISVREAAILQTFPKDYFFDTPYIEYACNIIGNALPCDFAEALGRECYKALSRLD